MGTSEVTRIGFAKAGSRAASAAAKASQRSAPKRFVMKVRRPTGDENAYWEMGEEAAVWALTDGPYAALAKGKSYELLMSKLPLVWTMYFTTGTLETAALPGVASFKIVGNELPHICIEYAVMGFARRAIEMVGKVTKETRRLRGIKDGDGSVVHYEFVI